MAGQIVFVVLGTGGIVQRLLLAVDDLDYPCRQREILIAENYNSRRRHGAALSVAYPARILTFC